MIQPWEKVLTIIASTVLMLVGLLLLVGAWLAWWLSPGAAGTAPGPSVATTATTTVPTTATTAGVTVTTAPASSGVPSRRSGPVEIAALTLGVGLLVAGAGLPRISKLSLSASGLSVVLAPLLQQTAAAAMEEADNKQLKPEQRQRAVTRALAGATVLGFSSLSTGRSGAALPWSAAGVVGPDPARSLASQAVAAELEGI